MANKKYEMVFRTCADSWEKVTPSVVETMFDRAEDADIRLLPFKNWLLKQKLTDAARNKVNQYYELILEERKQEKKLKNHA
ncbi:hypothetical protein CN918_29055 [Priestia megaterium]|nr:hypothetical protein CN918_29055 [Priestia megaterium]